jgi:hypothetical protein
MCCVESWLESRPITTVHRIAPVPLRAPPAKAGEHTSVLPAASVIKSENSAFMFDLRGWNVATALLTNPSSG